MKHVLKGKLRSYSLDQVSVKATELEGMIKRGDPCAVQKEKELLSYLVTSTKVLIEGRDEGFINNIRGLQLLKFIDDDEAAFAIKGYNEPDPKKDLRSLIELIDAFADRLPLFKENLKC